MARRAIRKTDGCAWVHRENWIHMSRKTCQNFIYCRPVMKKLCWLLHLLRPDTQNAERSSSPCTQLTQYTGGNHSSCVCIHVYGRLKSFVLQLSCSSAVFPRQARSYKLTQLLAGKRGEKVDAFLHYLSFACACMDFLSRFPSRFDLRRRRPPSACVLLFLYACEPLI